MNGPCWHCAQEPRCQSPCSGAVQPWIQMMATYFKTLNTNHMVRCICTECMYFRIKLPPWMWADQVGLMTAIIQIAMVQQAAIADAPIND